MGLPKIHMRNLNVPGMPTSEKLNIIVDYVQELEKQIRHVLGNPEEDEIKKLVLQYAYPVGAIYMSTKRDSPAALFGGTWAQIEGTYYMWERIA